MSVFVGPSCFCATAVTCMHLHDRTESLKPPPVGPVTWPSEKWTSWWKVCVHVAELVLKGSALFLMTIHCLTIYKGII